MHYIDKTNNEPQALIDWKEHHATRLQEMYENAAVTGERVYKYMDEHRELYDKDQLRLHLLQEQGYICCYCGQKLSEEKGKTAIEHLSPKSVFKDLTYDYGNLLLSCMGGSRPQYHKVQAEETLASIAEQYETTVAYLLQINNPEVQLKLFGKVYDLTQLEVGKTLIIVPQANKKELHCDTRKGKTHPLPIHPLQQDCATHFSYNKQTGEIKISDEIATTVEMLGLNANPHLVQNRKNIVEETTRKLGLLLERFRNDRAAFNQARIALINKYKTLDDGKFTPFCFVYVNVLEGK